MLQAGRLQFDSRGHGFLKSTHSFQLQYGPVVDSSSNRNEYHSKAWLGHKSSNLTPMCELIV
jgi:hypothetical protein